MRYFKYLISSRVVSGARELLFPPGLATLTPSVVLWEYGRFAAVASSALRLSIIAVARRHPQTRTPHAHFQAMKPVLGRRHILGIEGKQVLRAQILEDVRESLIEGCAHGRLEHAPAGPRGHGGQSVLASDIPAGVVGNRHHQDRINDGVGERRAFHRGVKVLAAGGIAAVGDDHYHFSAIAALQVLRPEV